MKKRHRRIQSFLVIAIASWVLMLPIYLHYGNFSEMDFFSPIPAFEILDQEDLFAHEGNKAKIFALFFSCAFSPFSISFGYTLPSLSFQPLSFDQPISILRC